MATKQQWAAHLRSLEVDLKRQEGQLARIEKALKVSRYPNREALLNVKYKYREDKIKSAKANIKEARELFEALKATLD